MTTEQWIDIFHFCFAVGINIYISRSYQIIVETKINKSKQQIFFQAKATELSTGNQLDYPNEVSN